MNPANLSSLLAEIIPFEDILTDNLSNYQCTTNGNNYHAIAAIKIRNKKYIPPIVKFANNHKVSLYPISTGNNWGYGGPTPPIKDCIILDLSSLNKIINFSSELGLVTLQPGVTQKILYEFLETNQQDFILPTTGAGPSCSILANALERGFGGSRYNDHFTAVTQLEAVLPSGKVYKGIYSKLASDLSDRCFKWGLGSYMDGLLTQSNLGIITEGTIALAPKPEQTAFVSIGSNDIDFLKSALPKVREVLFELSQNVCMINIINDRRVLSMTSSLYNHSSQALPIPQNKVLSVATDLNIFKWNIIANVCGNKKIVNACIKQLRKRLKLNKSHIKIAKQSQIKTLSTFKSFLPQNLKTQLELVEKVLELFQGKPNELALKLAYLFNNREPDISNLNPDQDGCGLIWYAPVVPLLFEKIEECNCMIYNNCQRFGFEPLITYTAICGRYAECTFPIVFDKSKKENIIKANNLYECLVRDGQKFGIYPYRIPSNQMHLISKCDNHLYNKIKSHLDPNNIISPGRYHGS